jgi:hypothetical protein
VFGQSYQAAGGQTSNLGVIMGSSASKEKGESSARHYLDESDHWSGDCPCVSYAEALPFPKRALYNMHAEPISTLLSSLPPEELAIGPLDTLHPTMPYELEYHHLDTVLNDMKGTYYIADRRSSVCFVPELSDTSTAQFYENGPTYTWSSEVYFEAPRRPPFPRARAPNWGEYLEKITVLDCGAFLQKQEITCTISKDSNCQSLEFALCPHSIFKMGKPRFRNFIQLTRVRSLLEHIRPSKDGFRPGMWSSGNGSYICLSRCKYCPTDHEQVLQVVDGQLRIRITSYKVLTQGRQEVHPKWQSQLTGRSVWSPRDSYDGFHEVFGRVWRIAEALGRPNLYATTHRSYRRTHEFNVNKHTKRRNLTDVGTF